ncbi:MAG: two-component system response regulator [Acidobacteria bacterium]|nr:MAG: two-component system response regulator [Acidobacteriota bacterium]
MAETGDVDILLVEDNPNDAELTQRAFRKSDLDVRLAIVRDGAEALDYLFGGKPRPKVVLLDLKLPKIDGIDVLRRIRAGERTRTIPVVVLTSSQEERDIVECYELGANSYVVKPVDFDRFYRTVSDIGAYWLVLNKLPL